MTHPHFFSRAHQAGYTIPNVAVHQEFYPNTNCLILNGKVVLENFIIQTQTLSSARSKNLTLAIILVGDNPASHVYVKNKVKIFEKANYKTNLIALNEAESSTQSLIKKIKELNANKNVSGILVQLPLPKHIETEVVLSAISPEKDVDGFSAYNIGLLALNASNLHMACTPFGIMLLLKAYGISVEGKHCVVVGRSRIVGKPMGLALLNENATVTYLHSYTQDIFKFTQQADILIVAAGKKHFIHKNHVKSGAIVVDVGIHKNHDESLSGDVHPDVAQIAHALTPVPKGVGPMTIAGLLVNTTLAGSGFPPSRE